MYDTGHFAVIASLPIGSMGWDDDKATFMARKNALDQTNVTVLVQNLNGALATYLSSESAADLQKVTAARDVLKKLKTDYAALNQAIITAIQADASQSDVSGLTNQSGTIMSQIHALEARQKQIQVDVDSALAREELLRSRMKEVSNHQLFLLGRPVRRQMIPYLWVLSILFVGIGIYLFRILFPPLPAEISLAYFMSMFGEVLHNTTVLYTLLGCALLVVLMVVLKIAGVFGK